MFLREIGNIRLELDKKLFNCSQGTFEALKYKKAISKGCFIADCRYDAMLLMAAIALGY